MPIKLRRGMHEYEVFHAGEGSLFDHGTNIGDLDDEWLALNFVQDFANEPGNMLAIRSLMSGNNGALTGNTQGIIRAFAVAIAQNQFVILPAGEGRAGLKDRVPFRTPTTIDVEPKEATDTAGPTEDEEQICEISSLEVVSTNWPSRKFKLKMPGPPNVIQVIAGSKGGFNALVKMDLQGSCCNGAPDCPQVHIRGGTIDQKMAPGEVIELYGKEAFGLIPGLRRAKDKKLTLNYFIGNGLFPSSVKPVNYYFNTVGCGGLTPRYKGRVEAFTNVEWKGKLSMGFDTKNVGTEWDPVAQHLQTWRFDLGIKYIVDKEEYELAAWLPGGTSLGVTGKLFSSIFKLVEKLETLVSLESWCRKMGIPGMSVTVDWPKLSIEGWRKNVENDDNHLVETEGDINLALDPIIGASIKTDILEWILWAAGTAFPAVKPVAHILLKIKEKAAAGVGGSAVRGRLVIAVELTVSGKVWGKLEYKGTASAWQASGEVGGSLGFTVEGKIQAEGKLFNMAYANVKGAVGMKGASPRDAAFGDDSFFGVKAMVQPSIGSKGPHMKGILGCSGMKFYYTFYAEVGIGEVASDPNAAAEEPRSGFGGFIDRCKEKISGSRKYETGAEWVAFHPGAWEIG